MRCTLTIACLLVLCLAAAHAAEPGLVAHWTFDEGSGAVARDVSGNGHDAALTGTEWVPSPRGYALRFDAKDDAARYGKTAAMNMAGDLTLALWVRVDPTVNGDKCRLLIGDTGMAVERNFSLYLHSPDALRFEWTDGKTVPALLASASLLNGTWKHIVVVANSTVRHAAMYIDGKRVAETEMPIPISKTVFKERLTGWFYDGFFTGDLDDARLYSRALSEAEVKRLFVSQADVQVAARPLVFDAASPEPRLAAPLLLRNFSKQPHRVELSGGPAGVQALTLKPGVEVEVAQRTVPLRPVWSKRSDLYTVEGEFSRLTLTVHRGEVADTQPVVTSAASYVEPLQVVVANPWQAKMAPGKTERVTVQVKLNVLASQLRAGALDLRLVSRESGKPVLTRQIKAPAASLTLPLDVRKLPWGAYDLTVSFRNRAGAMSVSTTRELTVLPGGKQKIRVLNNLVSELMDVRARGLLGSRQIEFMNPRQGWVWFRAAGDCALKLGNGSLLSSETGKPAAEAMRLLPAGRHMLQVSGTPTDLTVRAIPGLLYNAYPLGPLQITPVGTHTWERLSQCVLPNTNMIEGTVVDCPEREQWLAQGRMWIANVQAPGLLDKTEWTTEKMLEVWLNPGKPTAWGERKGFTLDKFSGVQVDEYYGSALSPRNLELTLTSIGQLADNPAFSGKLWIPFLAGKFGASGGERLLKTTLGAGWPFSEEVYLGEERTEAGNLERIRGGFRGLATAYEEVCPGSVRRMIFTPMYSCLPYCSANRCPQADFRVHLDMQMQVLANDPAFFGLWGVQPYRSNYVDEEILNCMGMLLRHYCIDGETGRMLSDPYELRHVSDPDFGDGLAQWQVTAAEPGSVSAATFAGYGNLQSRYPTSDLGDTFAVLTRSAKAPNQLRQTLQGLTSGRLYSLRLITADYGDLKAGKGRKDQQVLAVTVDGVEIQPGGFSHPFPSYYGPKPFSPQSPFWMTYHWLQFRAQGPTATLTLSDWAKPGEPGGPIGQQTMVNFVEVQPVLEEVVSPN